MQVHNTKSTECEILVLQKTSKCKMCTSFQATLRARKYGLKNKTDRIDAHSHVPYSILSKDEMKKRMKNLHNKQIKIQKKIEAY